MDSLISALDFLGLRGRRDIGCSLVRCFQQGSGVEMRDAIGKIRRDLAPLYHTVFFCQNGLGSSCWCTAVHAVAHHASPLDKLTPTDHNLSKCSKKEWIVGNMKEIDFNDYLRGITENDEPCLVLRSKEGEVLFYGSQEELVKDWLSRNSMMGICEPLYNVQTDELREMLKWKAEGPPLVGLCPGRGSWPGWH